MVAICTRDSSTCRSWGFRSNTAGYQRRFRIPTDRRNRRTQCSARTVGDVEPGEPPRMAFRLACDMTDQREPEERRLPTDPADPTENSERHEPTDPIDSTEPTEPMERIDPLEAMDRKEFSEANDHRDEDGFMRPS